MQNVQGRQKTVLLNIFIETTKKGEIISAFERYNFLLFFNRIMFLSAA